MAALRRSPVPTDQELIKYFLQPKVLMRNLSHLNVITDEDFYKKELSEIFQDKLVSEMYFFTPINKGKHIYGVITGKGAWKTQEIKEVYGDKVKSGKRLIGFKTTEIFVSNKSLANENSMSCSWILHKYTLNEDEQKYALCRIKSGRGKEEADNRLAALRSNLEKEGELHPVEVQKLSDETDSTSDEASESDDYKQLEAIASIPKDKGKLVVDDSEPNHVGSHKVAAPPDDFMQVIADTSDQMQLAGIKFSSKHYSVKEEYENLQGRYAELESQFAKMEKELNEKKVAILQKDWANKTLHDVLRNKEASYQRKLQGLQADSEQTIDNLKVLLRKAEAGNKRKVEDIQAYPKPTVDTVYEDLDEDSCCEE